METSIAIDLKNGSITAGGFSITPGLTVLELPAVFLIQPEQPVIVLGKTVDCQFAVANFMDADRPIQLKLRFEDQVLVSCFLTFPAADPDDELHTCTQWLADKAGAGSTLVHSSWGRAGIATDRSGNSHVFFHNKNNRWAR